MDAALSDRPRRLVRRARAAAIDLREPRATVQSLRALAALARRHPGLTTDLQPRSGKRFLIVSLTDHARQVRLEAIVAKALQLQGARVSVLTFRSARRGVRLLRTLGIRDLVFYDDFAARGAVDETALRHAVEHARTVQDFKTLRYRGARIGRQSLSSVVRARREPQIDLERQDVREALSRTLGYAAEGVHVAERVLGTVAPDGLLMIERGYAGFGSIFDVALDRGLPVVQFNSAHRDDAFMVKRYDGDTRHLPPRSLAPATWRRLVASGWSEERRRILDEELAARAEGRWFMAQRLRHSSGRRGGEGLRRHLGLDDRKVAVLFSHVLWDASMFYGEDLYPDQGRWFAETLRLAAQDESVQWLVKLHPALHWKLRTDGDTSEPAEYSLIREAVGGLPPHMRLIRPDDDVDNVDLFQLVDAGVTIRGTVGLELPALGVPVITAGTADYGERGFTIDPPTVEAYEEAIRSIPALERLDERQVELARLYAYGVFCVRPWRFSSFALEFLPLESAGHTLEHSLRYRIRTVEELRAASDLSALARWVVDSEDADYVDETALAAGAAEPQLSEA